MPGTASICAVNDFGGQEEPRVEGVWMKRIDDERDEVSPLKVPAVYPVQNPETYAGIRLLLVLVMTLGG